MKNSIFIIAVVLIFTANFNCKPSEEKNITATERLEELDPKSGSDKPKKLLILTKDLEDLLGKGITTDDIKVYNFWKLRRWTGIPELMYKKIQAGEYKRFVVVKFKAHKSIKELFLESSKKIKFKYGIDFIIAINENSETQSWQRCTQKICMPNGGCVDVEFIIDGQCRDECSSSSDCPTLCLFNKCENGLCLPTMEYRTSCPGQFSECVSSESCPKEGSNTTCIQKVCIVGGFCHTIYFQIDDTQATCPADECDSDSDCGEGEGGILDQLEDQFAN